MKTRILLLSMVFAYLGCGGDPPSSCSSGCPPPQPPCREAGQSCGTGLCCGGLICSSQNICETPSPVCRLINQSCDARSLCCTGLTCNSGTCTDPPPPPPMCRSSGQACLTTSECCGDLICRETNRTCGKGNLLDPCATSTQCLSGYFCNGSWCTRSCVSSSNCGSSGVCVTTIDNSNICFPYCPNTAYCTSRWPGSVCQLRIDTSGVGYTICTF